MAAPFSCPLQELNEFRELSQALAKGRGPLLLSGCVDSERVHLLGEAAAGLPLRLWITYSDQRAEQLADDARCFGSEALVYPAKDLLFYQADVHGSLLMRRRLAVVKNLLENGSGTIVTTIDALMERLAPAETFLTQILEFETGAVIDSEETIRRFSAMGYERTAQAEQAGEFAVRGGILDIFPLTEENPVRIELWGDEIDSIRTYDAETQRSLEELPSVRIFPAGEPETEEKLYSLLDYLPKDLPVFLDEPLRLSERAEAVAAEFAESMLRRLEEGYDSVKTVPQLFSVPDVFDRLAGPRTVLAMALPQRWPAMKPKAQFSIQAQTVASYKSNFPALVQDLKAWTREKSSVVILAGSRSRAGRLAGDLREYGLRTFFSAEEDARTEPGSVLVCAGSLHKGFAYPMLRLYVLSEGDLFGREKKKRRRRSTYEGESISDYSQLSVGDYVVHENHGLGIYNGTDRIEVGGVLRDYLKITYGDGGNLYIPVTQMDLVQKYADSDAENVPKLNRLNGTEWHRTKTRVRTAVREIAQDLVRLYAARQGSRGFSYGPDTSWQREFEEQFPFEETEDQLAAIEETKADMESTKIMDRLICGDVGFGKTEIAIRAAFKAVQEGRQTAFLVPTTILAQQHFNTFVQRLGSYPVNVELLCRFRTAAEQKKTVARLKSGEADIVIGTHRLLSADVGFKNLGLLVIDEEQRFGVSDKEKIKKLKENVDVLSLTATPIPRTLHMSLIGVRDMSVLKEAPIDRMPIQTYVMEYNDEIVREAVSRELARGGQVYYVYNKVNTIAEMTNHIAQLVPDATVAFAHGQMRERELERIMLEFINGEIDVLVSTTIVETGLDISNVNTILVHDADRFGLAQLYQLRGRVGRSNRTAYAFLLYRRGRMLKEVAEKRLSAIREYTALGSGIRIAMRDLELRGAGNLLGAEQHGHMEAVGYDLYCKLLRGAVQEAKGEKPPAEEFETSVDLPVDAFLPAEYIRNETQRMGVYRRIAQITTEEEHDDVQDELIDRFGNIPVPVQNLLRIALIRSAAHEAYVAEISGTRSEIRFKMADRAPVATERIEPLLDRYRGDLRVSFGTENAFTYTDRRRKSGSPADYMDTIREVLGAIAELTAGQQAGG